MDVVIAGAGVGGLALARGLAGHRSLVLEKAAAPRSGGSAVTVFSNGAAALAGIGAPLGELGGRIDTMRFHTAAGEVLFSVDLTVMARRTGFPVATIPRQRLISHLTAGLAPGTVAYDREVTTVDVREDDVTVTDGRGDRHDARLLVGADGHRSVVRRAVLSDAPAKDCGWTTWQGLTPALPELAEGATGICVVGKAGLCGLMPAGEGLLQWWFDIHQPLDGPPAAALADRFAGYGRHVSALLGEIRDEDLEYFRHVVHVVPDRWGTGAATLLGDSAHVFPPSQAQGANQALEDAWLLSQALRTGGDDIDLPSTLRRYEARRAPRVRKVSRMAARETTNRPAGFLSRKLTNLVPPAVAGRAYTALIRSWSSVLHDKTLPQ